MSTETIISTPFLTVPDTDSSSSEEGLLGLAFHPNYATNGKFYINVTVDDDGGTAATRTHIRGYTVSADPNVANPAATELLAFNQPQSNHNGGWIGFSPVDDYLYIMTGDGGNGNDTGTGHTAGIGNSQDITSNLLGKALRIDVEGRAGGAGLLPAAEVDAALARLCASLADLGIVAAPARCAGLRRLDIAADLRTDSSAEGLALLECLATASFGAGKLAAYRAERRTESVLVKTRAGRTLSRAYDKGAQFGEPPGRRLRFEAQWRFARERRPAPASLGPAELRELFARRFAAPWRAAGGFRIAPATGLVERIAEAVADGRLAPSRARTLAGYLLLGAAGVPQGAKRTTYELERECRELGLLASLQDEAERSVDVATVLDECTAPHVWGRA